MVSLSYLNYYRETIATNVTRNVRFLFSFFFNQIYLLIREEQGV